jgi:iron complex outermembrane recepter protein
VKNSNVRTGNIADFKDESGTPDYVFSNDFAYRESIYAAYGNFSRSKGKITSQLGLRYEYTDVSGHQKGNAIKPDSSFSRNYAGLFPTLFFLYVPDSLGKHQFTFSCGRRLERPNYQDMNPFTYPLDRFTLYSGNPYLRPTYASNFDLSYTHNNQITGTLSYSNSRNVISETIQQGDGVFYSRPGNIGKQWGFGATVSGNFQLHKVLSFQFYTEWMYNVYTASLYNNVLQNKGAYWYGEPTFQLLISDAWSAEFSVVYQTKVPVAQFVTIPVWNMRGAFSKKILKNQGSLKLVFSDVLHTNRPGGDIQGLSSSSANWKSILDTRVITFSLSYRFSKGKALAARKSESSDAEKSRVK